MMPDVEQSELNHQFRILLLPPTQRDAEAIKKVLNSKHLECAVCQDLDEVCDLLPLGAGAVIVSEEALYGDISRLSQFVAAQAVWSDLPLIALSRSGAESPLLSTILAALGNVSVLERPVRISTLLSVVQSALRARSRQYQARNILVSERAARSDAERASQIKDEFLATLSHELRTPLNAILGWSQIVAMENTTREEISEGIKIISRNARMQAQIIEDLLDMSAIMAGKIRLNVEEVDLADVIKSSIETVKPAAIAKGINVHAVVGTIPSLITGDPNRLQQVFWNLLSNAVKFTPKGGTVSVEMERHKSSLRVSVRDTGDGITPEFLPQVFDRFRQANASTTRRHGGLGLGLAIVKQLIELHGGSILVESDGNGEGTTFIVQIPVRAVRSTAPTETRIRTDVVTANSNHTVSLKGLRIVVVDDEPDARSLLTRLLEERGATVLMGESAEQAFELVKSSRPDVLLSDIGMPDEDGYSLIRRIRALGPSLGGNIPAVAITAYVRPDDRVAAMHAGFQHHLAKPIQAAELFVIISSLAKLPNT
ncbi:ATP-binding protein [Anatilimnocola sp. NA78]|uniref:hybrid sensor histidine kinase/response regulator n=1 Tax=Anatilimnocola sp. NA78 TaxID=3415683 RepID=UPI003CE5B3B8